MLVQVTWEFRMFRFAVNPARIDVGDPAEEDAALLRVAPFDELLVVHAAEEAGREAAGEALLQVAHFARRERDVPRLPRLVDRRAIRRRDKK